MLLFQNLCQEQKDLVSDLFNWLIEPSLEFMRRNCKTFVATSDMHLVLTLMRLYSALMDEIISSLEANMSTDVDIEDSAQTHLLTAQQAC